MSLRSAFVLLSLVAGTVQAAGDAAEGKLLYQDLCAGCHTAETHGVGPRHVAVVGRKVASQAGYPYSVALKASGLSWTEANLRLWLTNPDALVAGNMMRVKILQTDQEREDVIAYLKTLIEEP